MKKAKKLAALAGLAVLYALLCGFTDLPRSHWAYDAVTQLVDEGTVSGFTDGTFRPDDPVTRSQFVKMLGERTGKRNDSVSDLPRNHWAYDVMMHSRLRAVDGMLLPDEPATREQVAVYLYDCYADFEVPNAASVVTRETEFKNEVGWAYEHGIMVGGDGVNLRPGDTLTRAEAAALIVNSKTKLDHRQGLCDVADGAMLESVFNNSALFDEGYSPDALLTNGEAAMAAWRLQRGLIDVSVSGYDPGFEHKYAQALKAMEPVLGKNRVSAAFADEPAFPEDVFAMLAYAMATKVNSTVAYGKTDNYYKDAVLPSQSLNAPLTFAYESGIFPFGGGNLGHGTPVTHKAVASVLLQYDMLWGIQTSVKAGREVTAEADEPMRYYDLPENSFVYMGVLKSVPNDVYEKPLDFGEGLSLSEDTYPKRNYAFYNDMRDAFAEALSALSGDIYASTGADVEFTYYPSLTYDTGEGFALRVRAEVKNAPTGLKASDVFGVEAGDDPLTGGEVFWTRYELGYMFFMAL